MVIKVEADVYYNAKEFKSFNMFYFRARTFLFKDTLVWYDVITLVYRLCRDYPYTETNILCFIHIKSQKNIRKKTSLSSMEDLISSISKEQESRIVCKREYFAAGKGDHPNWANFKRAGQQK